MHYERMHYRNFNCICIIRSRFVFQGKTVLVRLGIKEHINSGLFSCLAVPKTLFVCVNSNWYFAIGIGSVPPLSTAGRLRSRPLPSSGLDSALNRFLSRRSSLTPSMVLKHRRSLHHR